MHIWWGLGVYAILRWLVCCISCQVIDTVRVRSAELFSLFKGHDIHKLFCITNFQSPEVGKKPRDLCSTFHWISVYPRGFSLWVDQKSTSRSVLWCHFVLPWVCSVDNEVEWKALH